MTGLSRLALLIAGAAALSTPGHAQDASIGQEIFQQRCSICHGPTGAGEGIVGELFTQKPKDLRLLAKEAGGAFPFSEVYQAIDGRREIAGHGSSEMPIWGEYFMTEAIDNPAINEKDARLMTQGRILSVVYYLQTIQQ